MAIAGLDNILANQGPAPGSDNKTRTDEMGKDQFFKLLVKQLQYQDPLKPVENTEFTAQLAQFTSLEQLSGMNSSMEELAKLQGSINNMQALSFIGKEVNAMGNIVHYDGEPLSLDFDLADSAAEVKIQIYDKSTGNVVRTVTMENLAKGDTHYEWDGNDMHGEQVAQGRYGFAIQAVDQDGLHVNGKTYATGTVTGVRFDGGVTYLILGDKEVTIADVEKINS